MQVFFAALLGYLVGSIPFGLLLAKAAGKGDIRQIGSGNIGATNVLRTGSKGLAAAVLLLDLGKGFLAVWAAWTWFPAAVSVAALAVVVGHCFPIWLKFKGGKGVATYLGLLAAFAWPIAIFFALVWVLVAFTTRYSSASALTASLLSPIGLLLMGYQREALLFTVLSVALWVMHRANIGRLLNGTESRFGQKREG